MFFFRVYPPKENQAEADPLGHLPRLMKQISQLGGEHGDPGGLAQPNLGWPWVTWVAGKGQKDQITMGFQEFWIQKMVISNIFFEFYGGSNIPYANHVLMEYVPTRLGHLHGAYGYDDKYR